MKKLAIIISLITVLSFSSCKKDRDFNGEREDFESFLGTELIEALDSLGYTMYYGDKPPQIGGEYLVDPFKLISTTVPGDFLDQEFSDMIINFYGQNNYDLTIDFKGEQIIQNSIGKGTFISGNGKNFTVVVKTETTNFSGGKAESVFILSGQKTFHGIDNLEVAAFMVKLIAGDAADFIPENTGRVFIDGNYFSEEL